MTTFSMFLEWNTISIQMQMVDYLTSKGWTVTTSIGFADSGESALIVEAEKKRYVIEIEIENEAKEIRLRGGIHGKYLPEGRKLPQFKRICKSTELKEASDFFVEMEEWCSKNG